MFVEPNFDAPIDFEARLAAIPAKSVVRGMFLQLLQQSVGPDVPRELRDRRYVAFKNYPMRDYVELLAACCADRNARVSAGQRVRELGRGVYPAYARTITGTAIFAVAGHNYRRVLELSPTAYRVSVESAKVSVRSITEGHAIVELHELWNLPDLHQVGIFEGAMLVCNARGTVRVEPIDFGAANLEITWQDSARS